MAGAEGMNATMLLCDAAQSIGGKLYILGGGWSETAIPVPPSMALAVKLEMPRGLAEEPLGWEVRLVTEGGETWADGGRPTSFGATAQLSPRPGHDRNYLDASFALQVQFQELLPPGDYVWELRVREELAAFARFRVVSSGAPAEPAPEPQQ